MCCSCGVVWDVEGAGGLPVRRQSYRGHRVELWRISDGLKNDKKQTKVKQSIQTRVYLGLIRSKTGTNRFGTGTNRFGPMAGLVGYVFDLILEYTCFWPQTDQVYLFLDAALFAIQNLQILRVLAVSAVHTPEIPRVQYCFPRKEFAQGTGRICEMLLNKCYAQLFYFCTRFPPHH